MEPVEQACRSFQQKADRDNPMRAETIRFRCPSCDNKLKVSDECAGRSGRCPLCGSRLKIPAAGHSTSRPQGVGSAATIERKRLWQKLRSRLSTVGEHGPAAVEERPQVVRPAAERAHRESCYQLRDRLIGQYKGVSLAEALGAEEFASPAGNCLRISRVDALELSLNAELARSLILAELKLVYGIGPRTETVLKALGYKDMRRLREHPRFESAASEFLRVLESGNLCELLEHMERRFSCSHPALFATSALSGAGDFLFVDIETLGLRGSQSSLILLGMGWIEPDGLRIEQFLLRDLDEESAALAVFANRLGGGPAIVTFNGRSFDLPFIQERMLRHGFGVLPRLPHYDVYLFARRAWKGLFSTYRLEALEVPILGVRRGSDIPSSLVPEFYFTYLQTGNPGPLVPVVEHNRQDIVSLARLFARLHCEWCRANGT